MSGKSQGQASAVSTPYTVHSVPFFLETFKTKKKKRKEKRVAEELFNVYFPARLLAL